MSGRESGRRQQAEQELVAARTSYEALNTQLLSELPSLLELATQLYCQAVAQLAQARKLYVGSVTRELLAVMDIYRLQSVTSTASLILDTRLVTMLLDDAFRRRLPLLCRSAGDIVEVFLIKHSLVSSHYGRLSFASPAFRPEPGEAAEQEESGQRVGGAGAGQTEADRARVRARFPPARLYTLGTPHQPRDELEVAAAAGDLAGVIQQKDPLGNRARWFCELGHCQGFIAAEALVPCSQLGAEQGETEEVKVEKEVEQGEEPRPVAVVAPYDQVGIGYRILD